MIANISDRENRFVCTQMQLPTGLDCAIKHDPGLKPSFTIFKPDTKQIGIGTGNGIEIQNHISGQEFSVIVCHIFGSLHSISTHVHKSISYMYVHMYVKF